MNRYNLPIKPEHYFEVKPLNCNQNSILVDDNRESVKREMKLFRVLQSVYFTLYHITIPMNINFFTNTIGTWKILIIIVSIRVMIFTILCTIRFAIKNYDKIQLLLKANV